MLIPYPFALLSASTVFDLMAHQRRRQPHPRRRPGNHFGHTAAHLQDAGLLAAVAAAVPGLIDYFGSVPDGTTAKRDATWHAALNSSALGAFLLARRERRADGGTTDAGITLSLLGTTLLGLGGWLGGNLVYHHHIGVDDASPSAVREAAPQPRLPQNVSHAV
jgi:uncharacterized membrane protein